MTHLEVLRPQPSFPREDLSEANATQIGYYLNHERGDKPYSNFLRGSLRGIHATGHQALQIFGVSVDYTPAEYDAFCNGFAALEYTSLLVNPRQYNGTVAVRKTQQILINGGEIAPILISDRYKAWLKSHQNTHGVIVDAGAKAGETMKQLHARGIGAQIASDLQTAR